ncbi:MAG: glycine cleavage system protein GcvH [Acidobacteriota bacterium]
MQHPEELKYTKDHEWVRIEGDTGTVGITHHAQDALGDVVFVELPEPGANLERGAEFGTVESVKAVSELYAPLSGEVLEVNEALADAPETVNDDPHGEGWMLKVKIGSTDELSELMSAADYQKLLDD